MSLSNIINKTLEEVVPYNVTVNSLNAVTIQADNIVVQEIDQDTLNVNLIGGLTIPDEVIVEASLVPLDDAFYDLGDPTHSWDNVYANNFIVNTITSTEVDCDVIKGLSAEDLQIDLGVAGILSIGPTGDLAAVQIQPNGVITSDSASGFSSLSLGNGMGTQVILDPATSSLIGSPDMNVTASNNVAITANGGSIQALCATTLDISAPSGMTVSTFGSGMFVNDAAGSILEILSDSINLSGIADLAISSDNGMSLTANGGTFYATSTGDLTLQNFGGSNMLLDCAGDMTLQAFGNGQLSAQTGAMTVSGQTTATLISGSGTVVRAQTNNVQLNSVAGDIQMLAAGTITSSAPFYSGAGSQGAPTYSFSSDSNTGIYQFGIADTLGITTGGTVRMTVDNTNIVSMDHILPVSTNTYDLGSAGLAWRNIYSNNVLNVISDARMKKNVNDLPLGLDLIKKIRPVSYQLIQDPDNSEKKLGVIAQELESAMHQCGYNGFDIVTKGDIYSVKYEALIGPLINAVKELAGEVERLRARVNV